MDLDRAEKPLRQMRKLLKRMAEDPAPEQVHRLRTRARRIEAIAGALGAVDAPATKRLLKAIKPLRKAAGSVRDRDVLAANLLGMPRAESRESLVKLEEHLGATRKANADRLTAVIDRQRKKTRRALKSYGCMLEAAAAGKKPVQREAAQTTDSKIGSASRAERLTNDLARWPALNHRNLHDFRLKVKELRYVLQMCPGADQRFVQALGKVKDQIGEWHDWEQLLAIARAALDARADRELLQLIEAASRRKFTQALDGANTLRQNFLSGSAQEQRRA